MIPHTPPMDPAAVDELSSKMLEITQATLGDHLQAMIVKGSAIKGDFIPHFSDFDVHIFTNADVMRGPLTPSTVIALPFQKRFSEIDVPAYKVSQVQVMFVSNREHPPGWIPAQSGSFRLIYGELPASIPGVSPEIIRAHARAGLKRCPGWVDTILERIVDKPLPKLADNVRLAGTIMKAALYEAAIVRGSDPYQTWNMSLGQILELTEPAIMPSRPASRYYERAWRWSETQRNGDDLRAMLADGLTALEALGSVPGD